MALALWREAPLEEVLRVVCEGLQWLSGGKADAVQASKSAISQARSRLGPEVMQRLAELYQTERNAPDDGIRALGYARLTQRLAAPGPRTAAQAAAAARKLG